jgi:hypothetical protein
MSKELISSMIERQNVLNNPFAVTEIQGKLKKEKNLGTQVQLNTRIKRIKDRIEDNKAKL